VDLLIECRARCEASALTLRLLLSGGAVMIFFGDYAGTARTSGFHWVNPFYLRRRLLLRAHNLTTPILKVNDERGNPIEIGAVVVWRRGRGVDPLGMRRA
jgi:regulator of protease activity HflC (stomatin/prohibitin superfamily)